MELRPQSIAYLAAIAAVALSLALSYLRAPCPDPSAPTTPQNSTALSLACSQLVASNPEIIYLSDSASYASSLNSYFTLQAQEVRPACVARPSTAQEASRVLQILHGVYLHHGADEARFAIRSGGHALSAGSANAQDGVTVDMSGINSVSISPDASLATIGTGARWRQVNERLGRRGLAVVGGRDAGVGVGGFLLGGGLSFFSRRKGFACDSVVDYEVILGNGSVVHANEASNPDLWVALKGGSNNFGVVTYFTTKTFPQGEISGGYLFSPAWTVPRQMDAIYTSNLPDTYDEYASSIFALAYAAQLGISFVAHNIQYTKAEAKPPCFRSFWSIFRVWSTVKLRSLASSGEELHSYSPANLRRHFRTTTFSNNQAMLHDASAYWKASTPALRSAKGMIWSLVFQPVPPAVTSKGLPNSLGLSTSNSSQSLVIALLTTSWDDKKDDELVEREAARLLDRIDDRARELGVAQRYRYLNYASPDQDPIASYGPESVESMHKVSRAYDPHGMFQRACVGGFKLPAQAP